MLIDWRKSDGFVSIEFSVGFHSGLRFLEETFVHWVLSGDVFVFGGILQRVAFLGGNSWVGWFLGDLGIYEFTLEVLNPPHILFLPFH